MALNFDPNIYPKKEDFGATLDNIFGRVLQAKIAESQIKQAQASQELQRDQFERQKSQQDFQRQGELANFALANRGLSPEQVTPGNITQALQPKPSGFGSQWPQPGEQLQGQEPPHISALRDILTQRQAMQSLSGESARAELEKKQSETEENRAQAKAALMGPSGGKPIQPTQSEFVARNFADMAKQAEANLDKLLSTGYDPTAVFSTRGFFPEATKTQGTKSLENAQRTFVQAVLRRESGATITPSEMKENTLKYFPMPNDGPDVLSAKKQLRQLAIAGLEAEGARVPSKTGDSGPIERMGKLPGQSKSIPLISEDGGKTWRPK